MASFVNSTGVVTVSFANDEKTYKALVYLDSKNDDNLVDDIYPIENDSYDFDLGDIQELLEPDVNSPHRLLVVLTDPNDNNSVVGNYTSEEFVFGPAASTPEPIEVEEENPPAQDPSNPQNPPAQDPSNPQNPPAQDPSNPQNPPAQDPPASGETGGSGQGGSQSSGGQGSGSTGGNSGSGTSGSSSSSGAGNGSGTGDGDDDEPVVDLRAIALILAERPELKIKGITIAGNPMPVNGLVKSTYISFEGCAAENEWFFDDNLTYIGIVKLRSEKWQDNIYTRKETVVIPNSSIISVHFKDESKSYKEIFNLPFNLKWTLVNEKYHILPRLQGKSK